MSYSRLLIRPVAPMLNYDVENEIYDFVSNNIRKNNFILVYISL